MLSPQPLSSAGGRGPGYWLGLTATTSYYLEPAEPKGIWYGLGAREFGLSGEVKDQDLIKLCDGYHPKDDKLHVRNAGVTEGPKARKFADDLCFGAPKSVSVAWALADENLRVEIEKKLHRAVKDACDFIQAECGMARVGAQGQTLKQVPLTFALFEHSSNRLGEPHLHVHALCPNLTLHEDSYGKLRVTAFDSTLIYDMQHAAGSLFLASLAAGMRELGFEVEKDRFAFHLKGFSEELCDRFSQRRNEIVEAILDAAKHLKKISHLDEREILVAARGQMAQLVTLATREQKQEYTRAEMFPVWNGIAQSMGIPRDYVESLRKEPRHLSPLQKEHEKEQAFQEAMKQITEQYSHFGKKDLTQRLAQESQTRGLTARDVRELVESKIAGNESLNAGDIVTKKRDKKQRTFRDHTETRFTTEEILLMEGLMLASVERMAKEMRGIKSQIAEAVIGSREQLSDEQAKAVRLLTAGPGRIACMTGKAGTGKSTTLEACRLAWELAGRCVIGCAIQGATAKDLGRTAGIAESRTLASLIHRLENNRIRLTEKHVVVLDEAGMVPTKLMHQLIKHVEKAGAKLVLVGDAKQLQAIGAGGPFRSISERLGEAGHCILTTIRRQREEWRRKAVEHFSQGEAKEALLAYAAKGQLHVTKTREDAVNGLVSQWKADNGVENPKDVLLLCSLNVEVSAVNRLCQQARREAGKLKESRIFVNGEHIHEGDRVMLGKNDSRLDVKNGFCGEVIEADQLGGILTVKLDKDRRAVKVSVKDYGAKNIRHAYAVTVHKSQGKTVPHCHVLMGGHMSDLHLAYVQASRSRESTHLFVDQASAGPDLKDAIRTLSRDRSKDLARDIIDRTYEQPAQERERAEQQRDSRQIFRGISHGR